MASTSSSDAYPSTRVAATGGSTLAQTQSSPSIPHQPHTHSFPKQAFGKKNVVWHAFQAKWFDCHSWLHYDEGNDLAFCYLCMQASKEKKLMASKCIDEAFTTRGFSN